jgi:hypothetical protein
VRIERVRDENQTWSENQENIRHKTERETKCGERKISKSSMDE